MTERILLLKPPFFSPLTPPLGLAVIKSYLEQHGYAVTCYDYNVDFRIWGTHHKYFKLLQSTQNQTISDGYSKLWFILNAHCLAYLNSGGDEASCRIVVQNVAPLYDVNCNLELFTNLHAVVTKYFARLHKLTDQMDFTDVTMVGTSTYTTSLSASLSILAQVKQAHPKIKTVLGGGISADDLAVGSENLSTLLEYFPAVDHIVLGEGERLIHRILDGRLSGNRVVTLADLQGDNLQIEQLPLPDFSDFNLAHYNHLSIEGARSCPFQCSFCSETVQWGKYRRKPKNRLVDQMIELAATYKKSSYYMGDSLMNPYITDLSAGLLEQNAHIQYDGYLRADKPVANRDRTDAWARSGCRRVRLGIESASASVLDSMSKMTSPETIGEVLKTLAESGIRTTTYWIAGFPGESEAHFQETLDFISEHHQYIYELEAHAFQYYPYGQIGSRLYLSESVYPSEVTDITLFKVFDVINETPCREERYERLKRISQVASNHGIINVTSMQSRYAAEKRWLSSYHQAIECY